MKNDASGANLHLVLIKHCGEADGAAWGKICQPTLGVPYVMSYVCHGGWKKAVGALSSNRGLAFVSTHEIGHNLGKTHHNYVHNIFTLGEN